MGANFTFTNALIKEQSPYLLHHAHNPVNWIPWSEQVFAIAKNENKPILLSIGYAACHWCHVMERESFENLEVAEFMNQHFINVKLDREERPDIDHLYMEALQAMTGAGGWPLNIFLLPDGKPFYGGTYFPPQPMHQRPSWLDVLQGVQVAFENNLPQIKEQAQSLTAHLIQANSAINNGNNLSEILVPRVDEWELMVASILQNADREWGGFGKAPKFPQSFAIQILWRAYYSQKNRLALEQAKKTLDKMLLGGIVDQLAGGFSRYSTDAYWQAPHFEKMLYDNALMITVLSEGYQITETIVYRNAIEKTIAFVERELKDMEGGYYASLDADSEGEEGKFYTWTYHELKAILPAAVFPEFCRQYQIQEAGNWEGTNILWSKLPPTKEMQPLIDQAHQLLLEHRAKRIRPNLDDKKILSWNALMIIALCNAGGALSNKTYIEKAIMAMDWLETNMYQEKENYFFHTQTKGINKTPAFLDDYAFLIQAYIQLNKHTANADYLLKAKKIMEFVQANFQMEGSVFFHYTNAAHNDIILQPLETYDGAMPSSNAMICANLIYLGKIFDHSIWITEATKMLAAMHTKLVQFPTAYAYWLQSFYQLSFGISELIAIGPTVQEQLNKANTPFLPLTIPLFLSKNLVNFPTSFGKESVDNQYYMCKNQTCTPPSNTIEGILAII